MNERFIKRLRTRAKKGMRGWPVGTIAFYGPDNKRASKVVASIIMHDGAEPEPMRKWIVAEGDVRDNWAIAKEIVEMLDAHGVRSTAMTDGVFGCPHQEGIDYDGPWCPDPTCAYWWKRDRHTGKIIADA